MGNVHMEATQINYRGGSKKMGVEEAIKAAGDEIDSLKSGFTNLDNEVNGDATVYPYADVITIEDAVPANLADCKVKIEPVQSGSGDPSPTNIRPITGHTEVDVQRDGRNLCESYYNTGATQQYYTALYFKADLKPSTTYAISFDDVAGNNYYANEYIFTKEVRITTVSGRTYFVVTTKPTIYISEATYDDTNGWIVLKNTFTQSNAPAINRVQLEEGNTAHDYVPYATHKYTIALGDTIYGGTVDFDSGVMTVTMAQIASYDGETIGEPWISDRDVYADGTTPTIGAQVVYPLSTPTTIQLTPQQIQLLQGQNTITASTGQISVIANGVSGSIGAVQEQVNDIEEQLPDAPTTDGAYVLTVTVADGTPTYSWESTT